MWPLVTELGDGLRESVDAMLPWTMAFNAISRSPSSALLPFLFWGRVPLLK